MNSFKNMSKQHQHGVLLVVIGVTFLLFISGIITKILFYPLLVAGFGLIIYGLYECDVFDHLNIKQLNKYLPKKKETNTHKNHENKK